MQLSEWDRSKNYLMTAVHLSPSNTEIRQELDKLNKRVTTQTMKVDIIVCFIQKDSTISVTRKGHLYQNV